MPTTAVAGGANWIVLPGFSVMAVVGCNSFCHGKALRWVSCWLLGLIRRIYMIYEVQCYF